MKLRKLHKYRARGSQNVSFTVLDLLFLTQVLSCVRRWESPLIVPLLVHTCHGEIAEECKQ